eukprot:scaffold447_cov307-Pinguiococcus_pyrenoidosus.AAC.63
MRSTRQRKTTQHRNEKGTWAVFVVQSAGLADRVGINGAQGAVVQAAAQRISKLVKGDGRDDALYAQLAHFGVGEKRKAALAQLNNARTVLVSGVADGYDAATHLSSQRDGHRRSRAVSRGLPHRFKRPSSEEKRGKYRFMARRVGLLRTETQRSARIS